MVYSEEMEEEYLDLVDANDIKIGTIGRSQLGTLKDDGGKYVRASYAFIQNSKGQLWIPRRTANKRIAPNGLDMAMAEHMGVDEPYIDAAVRGFQEELNLTIQPSDLKLLGILSPLASLPYFGAYYLYQTDIEPDYNKDDFADAYWMSHEEVWAKLERGEPAKLCLKPGLQLMRIISK